MQAPRTLEFCARVWPLCRRCLEARALSILGFPGRNPNAESLSIRAGLQFGIWRKARLTPGSLFGIMRKATLTLRRAISRRTLLYETFKLP